MSCLIVCSALTTIVYNQIEHYVRYQLVLTTEIMTIYVF